MTLAAEVVVEARADTAEGAFALTWDCSRAGTNLDDISLLRQTTLEGTYSEVAQNSPETATLLRSESSWLRSWPLRRLEGETQRRTSF